MLNAIFSIIIFLLTASSALATIDDAQIVEGSCDKRSHTAEGKIGDDLTQRQSRFYCDSAIITFFADTDHAMISFADKNAHHDRPISFAGFVQEDGTRMNVSKIYLHSDDPIVVSEGFCTFYFKDKNIAAIMCAAKIDGEGRRTTSVVMFNALPGQ